MDNYLTNYQYLYLHGFASSSQSRKAVYFTRKYQQQGIKLNIIDFNQPDFADLTLSRPINQVVQQLQKFPEQDEASILWLFRILRAFPSRRRYWQREIWVLGSGFYNYHGNSGRAGII